MSKFEVTVVASFVHVVEAESRDEAVAKAIEESEASKPEWYVTECWEDITNEE